MKVTSCAGKTSKVFLLFVNILTFLLGGTCIGLGIWYHLDGGLYDKVFKEGFLTIPIIFIIVGSVLLIISMMAIIGALCEVVCILKVYMSVVAIVLLIEVIFMAVCVALRGTAETYAITAVHNLMEHYGDASADQLDIITTTIDETQGWLKCCGLSGPQDWKDANVSAWWTNNNNNGSEADTVPVSCCLDEKEEFCNILIDAGSNVTVKYYTDGCKKALENWVEGNVTYISVVGIGIILLQCFFMICALKIRFELFSYYEDYYDEPMKMTSL